MKIILGQPGCTKCKMLKMAYEDATYVELEPADLLSFAQKLGIKSLPIVVATGEMEDLRKIMEA